MKKFFPIILVLILSLSCSEESNINSEVNVPIDSVRVNDSEYFVQLTPQGYTLKQVTLLDLDADSIDECIIQFKTNKKIACDLSDFDNCFLDELIVFKKKENKWIKVYDFLLKNPLTNDSINDQVISVDTSNHLILTSEFSPTCCSNIITKQYYRFIKGDFLMDSLYHYVTTKSEQENYTWTYFLSLSNNRYELHTTFLNEGIEESGKSGTVMYDFKIDTPPSIDGGNKIEELLPDTSLVHWY